MVDRVKRVVAVLGLVWLVACGWGCGNPTDPPAVESESSSRSGLPIQRVEIEGQAFELELAVTGQERFRGLSGRESIAADGGMLFVFPDEKVRQFVMRDCLVPIDIIFLDGQGQVLNSHAMQVEPVATRSNPTRRYGSAGPTRFAIELRGGKVAELGVRAGDRVELPVASLKARAR